MLRSMLAAVVAVFGAVFGLAFLPAEAPAAEPVHGSRCIAYVDRTPDAPRVLPVSLAQVIAPEVKITYAHHSTFRIVTPEGVIIATDYAGYAGEGPVPTAVTMNHAHDTHYTDMPDPAIKHVLRGWNPAGGEAKHHLKLADVLIRNVSTDIRTWDESAYEKHGNSIFIFEVADLCIGHLGHLHHKPTPEQFARIGRLDVVFAPVDGGFTLDLPTMIEVLKELKASLVIPMHYFSGGSLETFLAGMRTAFAVQTQEETTTTVSIKSLPAKPTILVMPPTF